MSLEKSKSIEAGLQTLVATQPLGTEEEEVQENKSLCSKVKLIFTNITVEPIMICYILPSVMSVIATQNLSLEKACRVNLALAQNICDALTTKNESYPGYKLAEIEVQKFTTNMAIYKNIIQSLCPAVMLLFMGSWSDRHKRRKPCIMIPIIGEIFMCIGFLIATYFFMELPIEFNVVVESVPPGLTGGWFSMFMGVFSFISGVSSEKTRTLRIGAVNMFSNISICVGIALSGILFQETGFYGVYTIGLVMYIFGLIYGTFYVKDIPKTEEDVMLEQKNRKHKNCCLDFFDLRYVSETLSICFKEGKNKRRQRVCIIMILVMFIIGPIHGEMNVVYFFGKYKFGWNSIDYSLFSTFQFMVHMFGTLFSLLFFSKYLKVDDAVLGMLSSASKILAAGIFAFAPSPIFFYLGAVVEIFNGTSFIAMRSIISKLVPPEELGKINSLFGVCEALIPLVYGPLYSRVYYMTIDYLPGAFFLVGGALTVPAVLIFLWLYLEHLNDKKLAEEENLLKKQEVELVNKLKTKAEEKNTNVVV